MNRVKIGIIGCGAIAQQLHIPAIMRSECAEITVLAEEIPKVAQEAAAKVPGAIVTDDYKTMLDEIDAVIIACPSKTHAVIAKDCFEKGVHVLVEKPMAINPAECEQMIESAEKNDCVLAVGMIRRFYNNSLFVKQLLEKNCLGRIKSFDVAEGLISSWKFRGLGPLRKDGSGGLLSENGVHILDLLSWWLGELELVAYRDDAHGGLESNFELELKLHNGAKGFVDFSRMRQLRNTIRITGAKASLELGIFSESTVTLMNEKGSVTAPLESQANPQGDFITIGKQQLEDFCAAIQEKRKPFVPGAEAAKSISLIEKCYQNRGVLDLPWLCEA